MTLKCSWGCSFSPNLASFRMHVDLLEKLGNQKQMNTSYQQMLLGFYNWSKCTPCQPKKEHCQESLHMVELKFLAFKKVSKPSQY
jgi:hypothetical protein